MENIPVEFEYNGKPFKGILKRVSGGGSTGHYHLMISNKYFGQLVQSQKYGWQFTSNNDDFMKAMAPWFEELIQKAIKKEKPL